jgi:uncharacterized protein (TIGR00255 family)
MHSMTGFGRGEAIANGVIWRVEASSVNRKQLEIVVHLPRELAELEIPLRNRIAERFSRGRVQVGITADRGVGSVTTLRINEDLARQYADALQRLAGTLRLSPADEAADITRWPGVFTIEQTEMTAEHALPLIQQALDAAMAKLASMRQTEGAHLKEDISSRLDALDGILRTAGDLAPQIAAAYRDTLRQRLQEAGLPLPLDDERLLKEIALFADRCDVSEEATRAASHIKQFRAYLAGDEPAGRSLDFLSQELFREFNTMGAKANNAVLAQVVVKAKTEIEKIREQVQNIE